MKKKEGLEVVRGSGNVFRICGTGMRTRNS
jgi:hypothetical protein